ncbi:hypothetical protein C2I18_07790 [Paenibacillus sp. PK3_47]|uniref:DUF2812 domain-containing protein n=1 Tax=Paenibacillus sp. PK3_47 TaxID=2072642 RepID=UPI00201D8BDB|nr:DUF2812 domain-containing protein [Paenibacillus sp. PK3_47]UQZ33470.1 hypothetical protein C2I18_07790 [Paenibacillus sp. PK3_47]
MTKKALKIFTDALEEQKHWLNAMASEGWRLVQVNQCIYMFEACRPGQFLYKIEFAAGQSKQQLEEFKDQLDRFQIKYFTQGLEIGKISLGSKRWRPRPSELLIMEKRNDGSPFPDSTTRGEELQYYSKMRSTFSVAAVLLALAFFLGSPSTLSMITDIFEQGIVDWRIFYKITLLVLLMPVCLMIVKYTGKMRKHRQPVIR